MLNTETLEKIKQLRQDAHHFEHFHQHFASKYQADQSCDKKGYGFSTDQRFAGMKLSTSFDSWAGYYGNSGCSSVFYVSDNAQRFFVRAMNVHQKELFATAARLMREEAATLGDSAAKELAALQELLDAARADAPVSAQNAA